MITGGQAYLTLEHTRTQGADDVDEHNSALWIVYEKFNSDIFAIFQAHQLGGDTLMV